MSDLDMNEYQTKAAQTAIYPGRNELTGLLYVTLGLAGEAGEFANKVKKVLRDDGGVLTFEKEEALLAELGGVLWYLSQAATELGASLAKVGHDNLFVLASRAQRGVLGGSGDDR